MLDYILGTRLLGPTAEVAPIPGLGGRAFDHSDDKAGDMESNKEKSKRRSELVLEEEASSLQLSDSTCLLSAA